MSDGNFTFLGCESLSSIGFLFSSLYSVISAIFVIFPCALFVTLHMIGTSLYDNTIWPFWFVDVLEIIWLSKYFVVTVLPSSETVHPYFLLNSPSTNFKYGGK